MNNKLFLFLGIIAIVCFGLLFPPTSQCNAQKRAPALPKIHPDLEQILLNWQNKTVPIKAFRGFYSRSLIDNVLRIEKISEGKFYYEKPNITRIDTNGPIIANGVVNQIGPGTIEKPFKVIGSGRAKWISVGRKVTKIDDKERTFEKFPIDPRPIANDINMMEGPVPFFFGMPVAGAKNLFDFKLIENSSNQIILFLTPLDRIALDSNFYLAKVVLNPKTYLPEGVQFHFPRRRQDVLYTFNNVKVRKADVERDRWLKGFFGDNDSAFYPDLTKHRQVEVEFLPIGANVVPSVTGLTAHNAIIVLRRSGFKAQLFAGRYANDGESPHKVLRQEPMALTSAKEGTTVKLFIISRRKSASK
ncbi:PASTA domain-containing protein [Gimesia aquarii]|uniref:PASTA domain-containing protein n=1 Tax=Gimesia aquarii TaxID=2527964 RepID=A0A517VXN5_9PLAN|nr:PASTA domain-containing protein [Gimesia aquarii]QDT97764.1 hypothetical protein V144x_32460 [Gimesia aquarii]